MLILQLQLQGILLPICQLTIQTMTDSVLQETWRETKREEKDEKVNVIANHFVNCSHLPFFPSFPRLLPRFDKSHIIKLT